MVGSGPGGLAAAWFLAEQGYRPLVLERGRAVRDRIRDVHAFDAGGPLDPESNYLFGEGGAGTFSDGKLTCRSSGPDVRRVLELFAECKGKPSILYDARPHLGSNRLPAVVKALRRRIEALGGEVRFSCRVEDLDLADGRLRGLATSSGYVPASVAVLAIGHSARDTYEMLLRRGVPMVRKPFQIGVRIEQPQETVNRVKYGPTPLEAAAGGGGLHAGGPRPARPVHVLHVRRRLHHAQRVGAGRFLHQRHEPVQARFAVRQQRPGGDDPGRGVRRRRRAGRRALAAGVRAAGVRGRPRRIPAVRSSGRPISWPAGRRPAFRPTAIRAGRCPRPSRSWSRRWSWRRCEHGLPILDRRWQGRFLAEATLVGPEARGSAPVRISRDDATRETPGLEGLYPVGEGAGYAGGIVSAAVDGLRSAKAIVAKYAPLRANLTTNNTNHTNKTNQTAPLSYSCDSCYSWLNSSPLHFDCHEQLAQLGLAFPIPDVLRLFEVSTNDVNRRWALSYRAVPTSSP